MRLSQENLCFDFLKQYGYHILNEDSETCITYVGTSNSVVIIYSEYSKEIYCQFEDIKTQNNFSLQDALDYQRITDLKGLYQISKKDDLYTGLRYISDVIKKVYLSVDISDSISFNKIFNYTLEKRNTALCDYYLKEELKRADTFFNEKKYYEAQKLYKKNELHLSQVQLKKLKICDNNTCLK